MSRQRLPCRADRLWLCRLAAEQCSEARAHISVAATAGHGHCAAEVASDLQHGPDNLPEGFCESIHWLEQRITDQLWLPALRAPSLPRAHRGRFAWPPAGRRSNFHVLHVTVGGVGCTVVFYQLLAFSGAHFAARRTR